MSDRSNPPERRSLWSGLLLGGLLTVFVATFAYVAYLFLSWGQAAAQQVPEMPPLALPRIVRPATEAEAQAASAETSFFRPVRLAEQEEAPVTMSRTTILLLGVDARPGQTTIRTDTIMLLTVNPETGAAGMMSIPRDLKVRPTALSREMKITSVYGAGEAVGYAGGGPALLFETVHDLLGYQPDYYVKVNFDGFKEIIDLIGGVEIDVPYEIYDDKYPDENFGYLPPVHFLPGKQQMDGETALKYARTRHADNDYARAGRQQQVILAIKDKLLEDGQMAALLPRLPGLAVAMANSVQTDMPIDKAIALARSFTNMELSNVARVVIDQKMGQVDPEYPELGYVLIPDLIKVRAAADTIFADVAPGLSPEETERQAIQAEAAKVIVLNGTQEKGLASKVQAKLLGYGFLVTIIGNAERTDYAETELVIHGEAKPATVEALRKLYAIAEERITTQPAAGDRDLTLIVGGDDLQEPAADP